jgi:hypothetical protein
MNAKALMQPPARPLTERLSFGLNRLVNQNLTKLTYIIKRR